MKWFLQENIYVTWMSCCPVYIFWSLKPWFKLITWQQNEQCVSLTQKCPLSCIRLYIIDMRGYKCEVNLIRLRDKFCRHCFLLAISRFKNQSWWLINRLYLFSCFFNFFSTIFFSENKWLRLKYCKRLLLFSISNWRLQIFCTIRVLYLQVRVEVIFTYFRSKIFKSLLSCRNRGVKCYCYMTCNRVFNKKKWICLPPEIGNGWEKVC